MIDFLPVASEASNCSFSCR